MKKKVLFICSQNRWRSLTAEKIFKGKFGWDVQSAGTSLLARVRVNAGHIGWADIIFVMEEDHVEYLKRKFGDLLKNKKIINLHIPDKYVYMDPKLIELLQKKVREQNCVTIPFNN